MNVQMTTLLNEPQKPSIVRLPFTSDGGAGSRARIGLIVLETDQTMEAEFCDLTALEGVAIYHARLANDPTVTGATLAQMEDDLPVAARLLPRAMGLQSIGYGCTSGTTLIGENRVAEILGSVHPGVPATNPLTAAMAAMQALRVRRIGLVTPYAPEVTEAMRTRFIEAGFEVPVIGSFYESDDFAVGKIDCQSILQAAVSIGSSPTCDGVFISCTSLRAANIIKSAEVRLGKPVTASNHALAWHLLRLAGINDQIDNNGRLFQQGLAAEGAVR